jgi:menaquinol-cytochrome c reductase iron-sulfur subunit
MDERLTMPESPSHSCCCSCRAPSDGENRRGFFGQAAAVVCGGAALLVPAATGVAAFLNPLRQKSQSGEFLRLASLDLLPEGGAPQKVSVIADRTDAWSRFPAEPIGAVFLRRSGDKVTALQVVCPHAGCSINFEASAQGGKFFCPCHRASFDLAGGRTDATSPSPRDMDSLEVEIRNQNEVWVKFQTFANGTATKTAQG